MLHVSIQQNQRQIYCQCTEFFKLLQKKVPDDGSEEPKHVAHFSMALKCVFDVTLCISKRILLRCLASVRFYTDLH